MITIISGSKGIGKTTFLLKKSSALISEKTTVYGILTPSLYNEKGIKYGFFALDLYRKEKWELARTDKKLKGPSFGPYNFSEKGFKKANKVIKKGLKQANSTIFLDEIGPLELSEKKGFYPCLSKLNKIKKTQNIFIVVRPDLIKSFIEKVIPHSKYNIVTINNENRNQMEILK